MSDARSQLVANAWRWKCGLEELPLDSPAPIDYESLVASEWSPEFETLMRNRLILGAIRYGKIHAPGKPQYDRIQSILKRMILYNRTGNKEYLVDMANLCLLEFEECHHPNAHFSSIDDGEHVEVKK